MKIRDIMTPEPRTCTPEMTLAAAAGLMWDTDCGILPAVEDGALVGVVTDRDICIALATRNARAAAMKVSDVAGRTVWTCGPTKTRTPRSRRWKSTGSVAFPSSTRAAIPSA
jgi:CBS domain-containing protein